MPRPNAPLNPFEPLGDDFDVPSFVVPPRPKAKSRPVSAPAPRTSRPTSDRPATNRPSSPRPTSSPAPDTSRSTPNTAPRPVSHSRPPSNSRQGTFAPPPQQKSKAKPKPSFSMRAVHFQIGGVLLVALSLLLLWNILAPTTDGVLPRFAVWILRQLFGAGAALVPIGLGFLGVCLVLKRQNARIGAFWRGAGLLLLVFLCARHLQTPRGGEFASAQILQSHGGLVGACVSWAMRRVLGEVGSYLLLAALAVVSLLLWSEHTLGELGERLSEKVGDWKHERKANQRFNKLQRAGKRDEKQRQRDEQLELWRDGQQDEPLLAPRRPNRSLAEIRAQNAPRSANKSPFLEVGDWFGSDAENLLPSAAHAQNNRGDAISPRNGDVSPRNDATPLRNGDVSPRNDATSSREHDTLPESDAAFPRSDAMPPEGDAAPPEVAVKSGRTKSHVLTPKLQPEAPRIEIIQTPAPTSVLDLEELVALKEELLSPQELLEIQALESAKDGDELDVPRIQRIEKPRRKFGDGPLMPEYFDDGVRALDPPVPPDLEGAEEELQRGVLGVQETLAAFKIDARVTDVKRGPVITRYEVQPAPGVRVAAIANLDRDLARSLSALSVRIEAPVPGKNVVGIEVPNKKVHLVRMRDVLEQHEFLAHPSKLAFVLGKDIAGQPKWGDLAKMPHMLIAGSTNSGKSVCLNSIIASILVRSGPEEVRFSLIDPKRVELTLYRGIPHLMHDVVVEPKAAVIALRRAIEEMDRRYRLFANRGVRNIVSYNSKLKYGERPMPYIVIVIDELADLMMTAAAEFEKLICRLAQLARATGIHLIVATQRPSVNVITGVIKANIPARVAFAVASQVDSRTILDAVGAERLIGSGDMLYDANNGGKSTRIQGAYLSEEEVNRIVEVVKANYAQEDSVPDDLPMFDLLA